MNTMGKYLLGHSLYGHIIWFLKVGKTRTQIRETRPKVKKSILYIMMPIETVNYKD